MTGCLHSHRRLACGRLFLCVFAAFALVNQRPELRAQEQAKKPTPNDKIVADQAEFKGHDRWIYNDLDRAVAESKKTGKPMLVVFRCVPCEACSHFDRRVIEPEPETARLLDRFVCVRVTQANGLDLSRFQFDWDQSFHVVFLDQQNQILARFGTRSQRPEDDDMTTAGFRATMSAVLQMQSAGVTDPVKKGLAGKQSPRNVEYARPELMPTLLGTYNSTLAKSGNIARSCIHCHQVRDAERNLARNGGQEFDSRLLYPYPLPDTIGLRLSPDHTARVMSVEKETVADQNKIRPGEDIISANGQRLLSPADFQWVLHQMGDEGVLKLEVAGTGGTRSVQVPLKKGWKAKSDLSWRPTSWNLRRMATGGLRLESMTDAELKSAGLADGTMALRVKHVGQFGEHATAKKAGFQVGDILVKVDGRTDLLRETDLFAYGVGQPKGQKMAVEVLRKGRPVQLQLPLQ